MSVQVGYAHHWNVVMRPLFLKRRMLSLRISYSFWVIRYVMVVVQSLKSCVYQHILLPSGPIIKAFGQLYCVVTYMFMGCSRDGVSDLIGSVCIDSWTECSDCGMIECVCVVGLDLRCDCAWIGALLLCTLVCWSGWVNTPNYFSRCHGKWED